MPTPHAAARRARLLSALGDAVAVLPTAPEAVRNADNFYPYRPDSHFLYLTGFPEPEAVLVLDGRSGKSILFCRDKNPDMEIWEGFRHGPQAAAEAFGFDEAYPVAELDARMLELLSGCGRLCWSLGRDAKFDARVNGWLDSLRQRAYHGAPAPQLLWRRARAAGRDALDQGRQRDCAAAPRRRDFRRRPCAGDARHPARPA
ncbi:aminopeptidase P N-terminal domain-containing protein [Chromobacterium haemolyticum]|nr:aminopeptidase P N-terminal domain-containing protein [Chromobacterium haemolyticum]